MTEHKYAQVLRWIADGKKVQCKAHWNEHFSQITDVLNENGLIALLNGTLADEFEFRLAPSTVKVGDVEIEAPLSECEEGATVFVLWTDGSVGSIDSYKTEVGIAMLESGRIFRTREAAEAAHAAWVKLMRGAE